jgi:putative endonuclease
MLRLDFGFEAVPAAVAAERSINFGPSNGPFVVGLRTRDGCYPMADHISTGAAGEQLACQWLERKGLTIVHRNWRHGRDELDIVARDGRFLVVVEVKTRGSDRWLDPELAVDRAKQHKLLRAANALVHTLPDDLELRFDIVAITHTLQGPEVLHIPNAFYPILNEQAH